MKKPKPKSKSPKSKSKRAPDPDDPRPPAPPAPLALATRPTTTATVPLLRALDPSFRQPTCTQNLRPVDTSANASLAHLRSCALSRLQSSWNSIIDRYSNTRFEDDDEIDLNTLEVVKLGSLLSHPRPIAFGSLTGYLDDVDTSALPNANSKSTPAPPHHDDDEDAEDDEDSEVDELIALAHPTSSTSLTRSAKSVQGLDDDDEDLLLLAIRSLRPPLVIVHDDDSEEDELVSLAASRLPPPPPPPPSPPNPHSSSTPSGTTTTTTTPNSAKASSSQLLMDAIASASSPMPLASPASMYAPSPSSSSFNPLASPIPRARLSNLADTPCPIGGAEKRTEVQHERSVSKGKAKGRSKGKVGAKTQDSASAPVRRSSRLSSSSSLREPVELSDQTPSNPSAPKQANSIPKSKSKPPSSATATRSKSSPAYVDTPSADPSPPPTPPRRRTRASVAAALDPPPETFADLPPLRTRTLKAPARARAIPVVKPAPPSSPKAPARGAPAQRAAKPAAPARLPPPRQPEPPSIPDPAHKPAPAPARKRTRARVVVTISDSDSDSDSDWDLDDRVASPPRKRSRKTNAPARTRKLPVPETPRSPPVHADRANTSVTPVESPARTRTHVSPPPPPRAAAPRRSRPSPPRPIPATTAYPATPAGATSVKHTTQPVEHVWRYSYAEAMEAKRKRAEALAAARTAGTLTKEQEILSLGGVVWAEMESGTDTEDELVKGAVVVVRGRR